MFGSIVSYVCMHNRSSYCFYGTRVRSLGFYDSFWTSAVVALLKTEAALVDMGYRVCLLLLTTHDIGCLHIMLECSLITIGLHYYRKIWLLVKSYYFGIAFIPLELGL